jgi:toxin ParE1/3/4
MKLRWSGRAVRNLISIEAYVAKDKPEAAARVIAKIIESAQGLASFPNLGRSGRIGNSRELIVPGLPYIIAYRVFDEVIDIGAVIHASRKWPEKL